MVSTLLTIIKLSISAILAAWVCIWILKPTKLWKRSWHKAEDWVDSTFLMEPGLNVIVFCFPLLAIASLGYVYLHLRTKQGTRRRRNAFMANLSNPLVVRSPIGMLSCLEVMIVALFIVFLAWTYYSNVSSDLKKLLPYKSLSLNRWQLKAMRLGIRFGSLSEACLALLLLPILRGMFLFQICGVQFESSIRYHIWLGNATMLFTILHSSIMMCVWASKNKLWMELKRWPETGRVNLAGGIALITLVAIYITSLPQMRRRNFQFFYFCHHLYVVFFIFFLLHAGAGHFYLVFAGVLLFALDKILRIIQSRRTTCIIAARLLPCRAVEIMLPKDACILYTPLSTVFLKIPSISKFQWHPFSITSSSNVDAESLSLMIKCQGPWTNSLYDQLQSSDAKCQVPVAIEGPYGPADFSYQRYDELILVAGGSGITPLLSIVQDVAYRNSNTRNNFKKIQLIYAVKKSEDLSMLIPISSLLNNPADAGHFRLRCFVTRENEDSGATKSTEMLHDMLSQVKTIIRDESSSKEGVSAPEGLLLKAAIIALASVIFLIALVSLTNVFIHGGNQASESKTPSWLADMLLVCAFAIAASCSTTMVIVLHMWRQSSKDQKLPATMHKILEYPQVESDRLQDVLGHHEICFGQRPNLADIMMKHSSEATGGSRVGVFVCGPESMQESVASLCTRYSRNWGAERKCTYTFNAINFSL